MEGKRRSVVPGMHWSGCTKCYLQLHRWLRFGVDQKMKGTIDKQSIVIGLLLRNTMSPCDVSEVITTSISPSWTKAVRTNSFCSGWSQRVFVSQNKILQRAGMGEMMRNVLNSYTSDQKLFHPISIGVVRFTGIPLVQSPRIFIDRSSSTGASTFAIRSTHGTNSNWRRDALWVRYLRRLCFF